MKPADATFQRASRCRKEGRRDEAYRLCEELIARNERHHQALALLGVLELEAGAFARAAERLSRASALAPSSVSYLCNLGLAYYRSGSLERAKEVLTRAVRLDPEQADATFNLGLVLLDLGDRSGLVHLERAATLRPRSFAMQRRLAKELGASKRFDEAIARFCAAIELAPDEHEVRLELAWALGQSKRFPQAEAQARAVLAKQPDLARAHAILGRAQMKQERHVEAIASFQRALELDASLSYVFDQLAFSLTVLGRLDDAIACLERAIASFPELDQSHGSLVFLKAFSPAHDAASILAEANAWNEKHARPLSAKHDTPACDRSPERKLRIGYVSPDFRRHVQSLFMVPLLARHDRTGFEVVCYSSVETPDERTERMRASVDDWHDVCDLGHAELAQRIRDDRIDVLVDLTMHMAGSRLKTFAERPAPVQISWLAYPGTTGLAANHYRVTDPVLDPPGQALLYTESSLYLPHSFWCFDPLAETPVNELPALQAGSVTFGCLNNFLKVNRGVLELWARVLTRMPSARLLMLAPSEWAREYASAVLERAGVTRDRVEFVPLQGRNAYLASYHRIDVALDTFPYNGHTTSLDALWMGVPVVTLVGPTVVGRAGLCLSKNLNLEELVGRSPDEFVERSVSLASDLPRLRELRRGLRERVAGSPLMDADRFARDLAALYRSAWRRFCLSSDANDQRSY